MTPEPCLRPALGLCLLLLIGCQRGPSEEDLRAQRAALAEAEAAQVLKHFDEARHGGRPEMALNFADYIVQKFPDSAAAATVRPQAEALRARVSEEREARRLRELWVYHRVEDAAAGGTVRTAYLYGEASIGAESPRSARARLVLRRHPQWGDDVYLLSEDGGFGCGRPCTVRVAFDDATAQTLPASIPPSGEPAVFVEDFKRFVGTLADAQRVRIEAVLASGEPFLASFEVGGYDPETLGDP